MALSKCTGCKRPYRPGNKQRPFGMLGNFCTWTCKAVSQGKAKRQAKREREQANGF